MNKINLELSTKLNKIFSDKGNKPSGFKLMVGDSVGSPDITPATGLTT
jgi:hypothetical protein